MTPFHISTFKINVSLFRWARNLLVSSQFLVGQIQIVFIF